MANGSMALGKPLTLPKAFVTFAIRQMGVGNKLLPRELQADISALSWAGVLSQYTDLKLD